MHWIPGEGGSMCSTVSPRYHSTGRTSALSRVAVHVMAATPPVAAGPAYTSASQPASDTAQRDRHTPDTANYHNCVTTCARATVPGTSVTSRDIATPCTLTARHRTVIAAASYVLEGNISSVPLLCIRLDKKTNTNKSWSNEIGIV